MLARSADGKKGRKERKTNGHSAKILGIWRISTSTSLDVNKRFITIGAELGMINNSRQIT